MRHLNPRKLMHSKWTACHPANRERHFMVVSCIEDDLGDIVEVELEAVLTKRVQRLPWQTLRNEEAWYQGWQ
ncbi:TIGR02450 family Trp-rich protein [Pseudomonas sp.]|jgi:tryptophan-rich hypothetical protein|uniref:TIGR02450 family Trp-rich protein n=1 Tax=Pseudomonas sp. TaxID=306 RepID=UPI00272AE8C6|nr:TIGR02450 family Trp-rich protein [Pseudomonas sp.]